MTRYNGWANYETWNVAMWLQGCNDMGYNAMRQHLPERTPDGVRYDDPKVDVKEIEEMFLESDDVG